MSLYVPLLLFLPLARITYMRLQELLQSKAGTENNGLTVA